MATQRPEGKYLIPGSNSNKIASALQKPKMVISGGKSKSQAEVDKIFGRTPAKKASGSVTGTGKSSGTKNGPYKDLPKSVKISGSATATKSSAAKSNAMTKNGTKINSRAGKK